jgi:Tfp pilus assembly protein PilF
MPSTAELFTQGQQQLQSGNPKQAETIYRQILRAEPANVRALYLLGAACQLLGKTSEALARYQEVLRLEPRHPQVHYNLGLILLQQGKFAEAAEHARQALAHQPNYADAYNILGQVAHEQANRTEARAAFEKAVQLEPRNADAHNNLGNVFRHESRFAEAAACFRQALQLRPNFIEAHNNLGAALVELGQPKEALPHYLEAIRLKPDYGQAYYNLNSLVRRRLYEFTPGDIERMKATLAAGKLSADDTSLLAFTLAEWLDQQNVVDEAFHYYRIGNDWRRRYFAQRGGVFSPNSHRRYIQRLIDTFDRAYFERVQGMGLDTEVPVFVLGVPRSGTSLVEQILATHPQVFGSGELMDIPQLTEKLPSMLKTSATFPECMASIDRDTIRTAAEQYLQGQIGRGGVALRITDKMPENYFYLGVIRTLFPKARIIHCRRDALDVCVSCYLQNFVSVRFATDMEDIAVYYRQYERLMAHWNTVLPEALYEVPYEELVRHQEAVSRELVEFLGLPWDERCLAFHDNPRKVQTASKDQVRRPMYRSSVGRWKRYADHLQPLIDRLADPRPAPPQQAS